MSMMRDIAGLLILGLIGFANASGDDDDTTCDANDDDKYIFSAVILVVGLAGMAPLVVTFLQKSPTVDMVLSLMTCFGGGALLTAALVEVIPEAFELYPSKKSDDYPMASVLICLGYWTMLFCDKVLISLCGSSSPESEPEEATETNPTGVTAEMDGKSDSATGQGHSGAVATPASDGCDEHAALAGGNSLRAFGVFVAMSFHSIMEGFALGLKCEQTAMNNLGYALCYIKIFDVLAVAIAYVEAGVDLMPSSSGLGSVLPLFVLALMSPIGIWAGIASDNISNEWNGGLQGFAAGAFLYVSIQELLAREFEKNKDIVLKSLFCLVGIGCVALTALQHAEEDEDCDRRGMIAGLLGMRRSC